MHWHPASVLNHILLETYIRTARRYKSFFVFYCLLYNHSFHVTDMTIGVMNYGSLASYVWDEIKVIHTVHLKKRSFVPISRQINQCWHSHIQSVLYKRRSRAHHRHALLHFFNRRSHRQHPALIVVKATTETSKFSTSPKLITVKEKLQSTLMTLRLFSINGNEKNGTFVYIES